MDLVLLSRWQFAITTIYHFFFVPLTLGLAWFVVIMETTYVISKDEKYKRLAKFWGKLFLINFALGVVTGLVQEFQFGMNWSTYSRFVGDIFGVPLAIEGLLAFFLESTFLGLWIFGWERLPKGIHAATIWLVAIGSTLSALWILIANGWMHYPVGYVMNDGRAELVDFAALIFNPKAWLFFWHTISAGLVTAAFFVLGISAYHLLRKKDVEYFQPSFRIAAIIGLIASISVALAGHIQGNLLRVVEPMAAAATEAHYETANPASFSVITIFTNNGEEKWSLKIPNVLSMLYYLKPEGEVAGINDIQKGLADRYGPGNYIPNVALAFWTFRIMVGVGFLMIALAGWALYLSLKRQRDKLPRWIRLFTWAILLPYIANTTGWILTETSRQPWIVTGLLKTERGVSPNVTAGLVMLSLTGFTLIYALLMVVDVYLLLINARADLSAVDEETSLPNDNNGELISSNGRTSSAGN